jgi:hypothetical protein
MYTPLLSPYMLHAPPMVSTRTMSVNRMHHVLRLESTAFISSSCFVLPQQPNRQLQNRQQHTKQNITHRKQPKMKIQDDRRVEHNLLN